MPYRVLVAYASRYGSTAEVARAIAAELTDSGTRVDVCPVQHVNSLQAYHAVILGSAVRWARLLPESLCFVARFRADLHRVPVAYFLTCQRLAHDGTEVRWEAASFFDPLLEFAPEVEPVAMGCFAGKLDPSHLPWYMRLMLWFYSFETGDFRHWDAIRTWAAALPPMLLDGAADDVSCVLREGFSCSLEKLSQTQNGKPA